MKVIENVEENICAFINKFFECVLVLIYTIYLVTLSLRSVTKNDEFKFLFLFVTNRLWTSANVREDVDTFFL